MLTDITYFHTGSYITYGNTNGHVMYVSGSGSYENLNRRIELDRSNFYLHIVNENISIF